MKMLNELGRRRFVGSVMSGLVAVNLKMLTTIDVDGIPVQDAIGLMRTLNTIQSVLRDKTTGEYASKDQMLGPHGLQNHQMPELPWMAQLNFNSDEILPGWTLAFLLRPGGYVLTLLSRAEVLTTTERGVIYRGKPLT
jgi:hypothetical protein